MIVHPEVGKWLIALGEKAFGMDPFGWRVAAAVVGALMVLVMCRLARRVTGSTLLGLVAGLLLSLDGLQFVLSRLALLDIFLAFFILCAVHCLVADRDWYRARLAASSPSRSRTPRRGDRCAALLFRPWLLAGGVCWGLAIGTKWTAIYPLAAFGVLVWLWSARRPRAPSACAGRCCARSLADGVPAFVHLVVVAGLVYTRHLDRLAGARRRVREDLSSTQYTQFIRAAGHCDGRRDGDDPSPRTTSTTRQRWPTATEPDASGLGEVMQSLRSLWYYHRDVYTFHTHFLNCSTHVYASKPPAGRCSTGPSASPPTPASSPAPGAATPPPAAPACARCC